MTYIITDLCLRHGACVEVCPVDCIAPGEPEAQWPNYYIDPEACIDCGLCKEKCPYNAIWPEDEVPEELRSAIRANYDYFGQPFPKTSS
jgi:NAD-dependent dihydropyrimidine dehydrogenase PreA subunit